VLARYQGGPGVKTAAFPPFSKAGPAVAPDDNGTGNKRNIPKDHPYEPRALKPMAKALWAATVGLGHVLAAYRHFSRLKSATISPDGQLGGRGYVMAVTEIRQKLYDASEALSAITDTLYDEISAPHWKPKLAQLDETDAKEVERFVGKTQDYMESPEDEAEEEMEDVGEGKDEEDKDDEPRSSIPGGGPAESSEAQPPPQVEPSKTKMASWKVAVSTEPVDTLPGPRVEHDGPGDGPFGSYNDPEDFNNDQWSLGEGGERDYDYRSEWENETREAGSGLPSDPDTETEAWDFGIGYGAHGQGAGGYENPSGEGNGTKGVYGPSSGLPGQPAMSVNDTTPAVDVQLNERHSDLLPNDLTEPVARSDYFPGDKGNLVNSESGLPGEASPSNEIDMSLVDTGYREQDSETPYVRYDYTTHTLRDDPLHNWPQKAGRSNG
jgi:hypothetical protein